MTLRHVGFTPVPPGARPGFDHADTFVGPDGSRLFVAHTGADRVDVLDCASAAYLRSLDGLPGVAGVLIDGTRDLLFTSDRAVGRVSIFRASDERLISRVAVGPRPNGLAFDPQRGNLFSFNLGEPAGTGCTASVVSIDRQAVIATLVLPGRPRWAVFDGARRVVYANISTPALIIEIDADALAIRRSIAVPAAGPHGLALVTLDGQSELWCAADACQLVVIHVPSGEIAATLLLPGIPDVVMCDRDLGRLFVAVGSPGSVSVFDVHDRGHLETIATAEGAHTIGWDPATRRLFAFEPARCGVAIFEYAA